MNFYSMILLGYFVTNIVAISSAASVHVDVTCCKIFTEFQYVRNNALRLLLSDELNRTKNKLHIVKRMIHRNISKKYNHLLSRYYALNYNYNCLTESEKTLLEAIVSLSY